MTCTQGDGDDEAIREAARQTASHDGIDAVLLYGSRARSDHTERSIALVTTLDLDDPLAAADAFYEGENERRSPVDFTVTNAEWLEHATAIPLRNQQSAPVPAA
jgi:predicted nucleotidyltransferase